MDLKCRESLQLIALYIKKEASAKTRIEILRLFLSSANLQDPDDQCWGLLQKVVWAHLEAVQTSKDPQSFSIYELYEWLVGYLAHGLASPVNDYITFEVLDNAIKASFAANSVGFLNFALDNCGNRLQVTPRPGHFTFLHSSILCHEYDKARLLLQRGADVYAVGYQNNLSPVDETPTSLALYTFEGFYKWRSVLLAVEFDLKEFIRTELVHSPLGTSGWKQETLARLFEINERFREDGWVQKRVDLHECPRCGECSCSDAHNPMIVDVQWQLLLEKIKEGEKYDGSRSEVDGNISCDIPTSQRLGLAVNDYEWVCLKCWHRAGCLNRRMDGLSDRLEEHCVVEEPAANDEEDDGDSPFLLRI